MCLGIPGRVAEVWDADTGARMARVEFPGEERTLCLAYLPDLQVGDYTIAHAGFALTRIDEDTARVTLATMAEYGVLGDVGDLGDLGDVGDLGAPRDPAVRS